MVYHGKQALELYKDNAESFAATAMVDKAHRITQAVDAAGARTATGKVDFSLVSPDQLKAIAENFYGSPLSAEDDIAYDSLKDDLFNQTFYGRAKRELQDAAKIQGSRDRHIAVRKALGRGADVIGDAFNSYFFRKTQEEIEDHAGAVIEGYGLDRETVHDAQIREVSEDIARKIFTQDDYIQAEDITNLLRR